MVYTIIVFRIPMIIGKVNNLPKIESTTIAERLIHDTKKTFKQKLL